MGTSNVLVTVRNLEPAAQKVKLCESFIEKVYCFDLFILDLYVSIPREEKLLSWAIIMGDRRLGLTCLF